MPHPERITVLGAGLAGALMTLYLARRGFAVDVFERRPDLRTHDLSAGRSINLALSARGLHALDQVGLKEQVLSFCIPMRGRMIHAHDGTTTLQRYGQDDSEVINSVSRSSLNATLLDAAEAHEHVQVHFEQAGIDYNLDSGDVTLRDERTGATRTFRPDRLLAADGAGSPVRMSMLRMPRFNYQQAFLTHGYKELEIPPAADGSFAMEPHALHIWPRGTYMMIALPNPDRTFTCTLFMPYEGDPGFDDLTSPEAVQDLFAQEFPDAVPLMPTLTDDFSANPTGALGTIRCAPWNVGDHALLLGDAAHAIVPFYGQGMNAAFEDCYLLDQHVGLHAGDWQAIFESYAAHRKPDADAIAQLAIDNYEEMRDTVNDPQFAIMRDLGLRLERTYPDLFSPKYSMVTFHRTPYAIARDRGAVQERLLRQLTAGAASADDVDLEIAAATLRQHLPPLADVLAAHPLAPA